MYSQFKADDAMPICEHARAGESTYFAHSPHILPGQVYDFGVQVSQEHILCSLLAFLKIEGVDKINTKSNEES